MKEVARAILSSDFRSILTISLCCMVVYAFMLRAPFKTLDDNHSIIHNKTIQDVRNIRRIFRESFFGEGHYYRPLVSLSFMWDYHFFGLNSFYYNLTNLLLHGINAITVFFLIKILLNDASLGFFSGLLFAVHPIYWEAVANIPGRSILLCALFGLNAFLFYVLSRRKKSFGMYGLSLVFFSLSLLAKESAAMLPIVLGSYLVFMEKIFSKKKGFLSLLTLFPYVGIIFFYVLWRVSLGIVQTYPWSSLSETVLGFLTFLRSCLISWRLILFPVGLYFDRSLKVFERFSEPGVWLTLGSFILIGFFLMKQRRRYPSSVLFFLSWFFIDLFPVAQIVTSIGVQPGYISTAEHFLYTPSIGLLVLMGMAGQWLWRINRARAFCSQRIFQIGIVGVLVFYMITTVQMNIYASSAIAMFERSLYYQPHNARILYFLGMEYALRYRPDQAEYYFRRSLALHPHQPAVRISLGKALCDQNRYEEGIREYEKVRHPGKLKNLLEDNLRKSYAILEASRKASQE